MTEGPEKVSTSSTIGPESDVQTSCRREPLPLLVVIGLSPPLLRAFRATPSPRSDAFLPCHGGTATCISTDISVRWKPTSRWRNADHLYIAIHRYSSIVISCTASPDCSELPWCDQTLTAVPKGVDTHGAFRTVTPFVSDPSLHLFSAVHPMHVLFQNIQHPRPSESSPFRYDRSQQVHCRSMGLLY